MSGTSGAQTGTGNRELGGALERVTKLVASAEQSLAEASSRFSKAQELMQQVGPPNPPGPPLEPLLYRIAALNEGCLAFGLRIRRDVVAARLPALREPAASATE